MWGVSGQEINIFPNSNPEFVMNIPTFAPSPQYILISPKLSSTTYQYITIFTSTSLFKNQCLIFKSTFCLFKNPLVGSMWGERTWILNRWTVLVMGAMLGNCGHGQKVEKRLTKTVRVKGEPSPGRPWLGWLIFGMFHHPARAVAGGYQCRAQSGRGNGSCHFPGNRLLWQGGSLGDSLSRAPIRRFIHSQDRERSNSLVLVNLDLHQLRCFGSHES